MNIDNFIFKNAPLPFTLIKYFCGIPYMVLLVIITIEQTPSLIFLLKNYHSMIIKIKENTTFIRVTSFLIGVLFTSNRVMQYMYILNVTFS